MSCWVMRMDMDRSDLVTYSDSDRDGDSGMSVGRRAREAHRPSTVSDINTNQCDQHSAPVRKRYRGVVVTELACWVISGPRRAVGRTRTAAGRRVDARACPRTLGRVAAGMRERVLGFSAVWPLDSGRVASGLSPRGVASFVHAARAPMVPYGG